MYSVTDYGNMLANPGRVEPYVRALREALRPGATVLDLGCGIGFFAVLAAQLGARHVYAIDPNPAIAVGKDLAKLNGVSDRITFLAQNSTAVTLPEPVDLIVSDLRGPLPLFGDCPSVLLDARDRCLAKDGRLIPQRDRLWAVPLAAPELYDRLCNYPWRDRPHGIDLSAGRTYAVNRWHKCSFTAEQCAATPELWVELDYRTLTQPTVGRELRWSFAEPRVIGGIGLWFEADLYGEIGFSNAPDQPDLVYGKAFLPLSEPVEVQPRDSLCLTLQALAINGRYLWQWRSHFDRQGDPIASFHQSSFTAQPRLPDQLAKQGSRYVPSLTADAQIAQAVLQAFGSGQSSDDIVRAIAAQYPEHFATERALQAFVTELVQRYG